MTFLKKKKWRLELFLETIICEYKSGLISESILFMLAYVGIY